MTALAEILADRAAKARAAAQVECGDLGTVTVEALARSELERLWAGPDRDRAVFYAACRELQTAGAALLARGQVFRPDQVMRHVSDSEAALAAQAVAKLSGWTPGPRNAAPAPAEEQDLAADTSAAGLSLPGPAAPQTDAAETAALPEQVTVQTQTAVLEQATVPTPPEEPEGPDAASPESLPAVPGPAQDLSGDMGPLPEGGSEAPTGPWELPAAASAEALPETVLEAGRPDPAGMGTAPVQRPTPGVRGDLPAERETPDAESAVLRQARPGFRERIPCGDTDVDALAEQVARRLLEGLAQAAWIS